MKSAAPPNHRRMLWALAALGVLLIPAVQFYRADRTPSEAENEASPVEPAITSEPVALAARPVEAWQEKAPRTGVDASNFYKNAFVLGSTVTDEEYNNMMRRPFGELDPDQAAAFFKKIEPILELLRQAAKADYCEWGLGEMNIDTSPAHLSRAQFLCLLAQWRANYRFPSDPQRAFDDLAAQARLGEYLADSSTGWMVQAAMESRAHKILRQNSAVLDEAMLLQAQGFLRSSTVEQNVARAFAGEAAMWDSTAKKLTGKTDIERDRYLTNYLNERPATAAQRQLFQDEAALMAEFHYVHQTQAEMAEAILWPDAQYETWWKGVESRLPDHPLAEMAMLGAPFLPNLRTRVQQTKVERAMLSAGLTLLQNGPAQFRDPVTGTAFTYVEKPDGFELSSTVMNSDGKPVTMSFARPK